MKKRLEEIKKHAAEVFDLPKEAFINISRLIMLSNSDLFIENHKGIIEYTQKRIRLLTLKNIVAISGTDLELKDIGKENVIISGKIRSLDFKANEAEKC